MGILDAPFITRSRNKIIAIGTSITEGGHAGGTGNKWTDKLPAAMAALLPGVTVTVVNAGVSGNNSAQMLARLPALLAANPGAGVLITELPVNDFVITGGSSLTPEQTEQNMRAIIARCELEGVRVLSTNSAPFTIANYSYDKQTAGNNMIASLANERNFPLIDLFNPLTGRDAELLTDGLHPNAAGQQEWANIIAKVLGGVKTGVQPAPIAHLVQDKFFRANSATTLGTSTSGHVWTAGLGTWGITSNTAYCASSTGNGFATVDAGITNQKVAAVLSTAAGTGLVARSDASGQNFYVVNIGSSALYKKVAGSYVAVGLTTGAGSWGFVNGDTAELEVTGTQITIRRNGSIIATATDSAITTGTNAGLWNSGSTARFDDFTVD